MSEPEMVRVLVVDDEEMIASTVAAILSLGGFVSEFYTNPKDALDGARMNAPDLLISDVVMQGMTGIELAIRVKEMCPQCRVLLFSGQTSIAESLLAATFNGHEFKLLSKPIHPLELLAAVRETSGRFMAAD